MTEQDDNRDLLIPRARVVERRIPRAAVIAVIAILVGLAVGAGTVNVLLSRIDAAQAEARTARAELRLQRALLEQHAVAEAQRQPAPDPLLSICLRRTDALRRWVAELVWKNTATHYGYPAEWPEPKQIDDCTATVTRSGARVRECERAEQSSTASGLKQADARRDVHESTETKGPGL